MLTRFAYSLTTSALRRAMSTKPILLYSAGTPNGTVGTILLEELKAVYGDNKIDYEIHKINLAQNVQKEPWFIEKNPNGRIPILTDHNRNDFIVFESSAILLYLGQHYDPGFKLSFDPVNQPNDYSEMLQWVFFVHGGVAPMQGQANHFNKFATEKIPYGMKRYTDETKRLYGVLELRLKDREYLSGPGKGSFSIADIKAFPWVRGFGFSIPEMTSLDEFPNLKAWVERVNSRPAVQAGLAAYA